MIIGVICREELVKLGEFPAMEQAVEVYGEQTELLGFTDQAEYDEFQNIVREVNQFARDMEAVAEYMASYYCDAIEHEAEHLEI